MRIRKTQASQASSRQLQATGRKRGSILILVSAVLVLLVLIGTAYIQAARLDRLATANLNDNYIDQVLAATLAKISGQLRDDILYVDGNDKQFFLTTTTAANMERHDYPHTNHAGTPGENDDAWLAELVPTGDTTYTKWKHITNLDVLVGYLSEGGSPGNTNDIDRDVRTIGVGGGYNIDAATVNIESNDAADADGDGLTDSRWAVAPIAEIRGRKYVMAVRIVDLSGKLNANVALSQVDASGNYDTSAAAANAPRWWYPSELGMGQFVASLSGSPAELRESLKYRLGLGSVNLPTPWDVTPPLAADSRTRFWLDGPAVYGNYNASGAAPVTSYQSYGIQDEYDLCYRFGLNRKSTTALIDSQMPAFLREQGGDADETKWNDSPYTTNATWFTNEPRKQMTVSSRTSILSPDFPGNTEGRVFQVAVNDLISGATPNNTNLTTLATAIRDVLKLGSADYVPLDGSSVNDFTDQLVASIRDYADADSTVTKVGNFYGMEALPFIAEVYRQRGYVCQWSKSDNWDSTTPGDWEQLWKPTGDTGYVIELRNPFKRDLDLAHVRLKVGSFTYTLSGAQASLAVDEVLLLKHNSGEGGPSADMSAQISGSPATADPGGITDFNGDSDVEVELQVEDSSGNWITYQKVQSKAIDDSDKTQLVELASGDTTSPTAPALPSLPTPPQAYKQANSIGNGNGINVMTITMANFAFRANPDPLDGKPIDAAAWGTLNVADKTAIGPANTCDPAFNQIIIANDPDGFLSHLGDLAMVAAVGPTDSQTIPERWNGLGDDAANDRTAAEHFMLDFNSWANAAVAAKLAGTDDLALPHAMLLMDRLTLYNPRSDGLDNDGDGTIDDADEGDDEVIVPGRINLNTAPETLLAKVLPVPDAAERAALAKAIVAYREKQNVTISGGLNLNFGNANRDLGSGYRDQIGIASMGEVYGATWKWLGSDNSSNQKLGGAAIDFTPDGADDTIKDDREEKAQVLRWLSQVCTTRSDTFAAYIDVRGYRSDDTNTYDPDHLIEQKKAIAIFDRSKLSEVGGQVELVGVLIVK